MSDPIYRKEILRLAANAAGAGRLAHASGSATLANPACGDRVTVDVTIEAGRITALAHHTHACVLTQASAAILGADAVGLNRGEMERLTGAVRGRCSAAAAHRLPRSTPMPPLTGWPTTRRGINVCCCPWKRRWERCRC